MIAQNHIFCANDCTKSHGDVTPDDFERNIVVIRVSSDIVYHDIDTCNMTINLLQQRCKNLKSVQSSATCCDNMVALKIICRR